MLLFIFRYIPIYGIVIAFQDFRIGRGIMGSPFNNFAHFKNFFEGPFFFRLMRNTLVISFFFKAITGDIDAAAEWDAYVAEWRRAGGDDIISELERAPIVSEFRQGRLTY